MKVTLKYDKPEVDPEETRVTWGNTIEIERNKQEKDGYLILRADYISFRLDHVQVTELMAALELVG